VGVFGTQAVAADAPVAALEVLHENPGHGAEVLTLGGDDDVCASFDEFGLLLIGEDVPRAV
jgi:hypothetical protein